MISDNAKQQFNKIIAHQTHEFDQALDARMTSTASMMTARGMFLSSSTIQALTGDAVASLRERSSAVFTELLRCLTAYGVELRSNIYEEASVLMQNAISAQARAVRSRLLSRPPFGQFQNDSIVGQILATYDNEAPRLTAKLTDELGLKFTAAATARKGSGTMSDDALESAILRQYIQRHQEVETQGADGGKCAYELDMREVLRDLTGEDGSALEYSARLWLDRLTASSASPLRRCSNSDRVDQAHRYHARAFRDPINSRPAPAWERIRELDPKPASSGTNQPARELEQKFGIVYSARQLEKDFSNVRSDSREVSIGVLFIDIDKFKVLNTRYTETVVDATVLPAVQRLLRRLTEHRGYAYRQGGEEFVIMLPNHSSPEIAAFAERVRGDIEGASFEVEGERVRITVSIGIAISPQDGEAFGETLRAANTAERRAKESGGNKVVSAG